MSDTVATSFITIYDPEVKAAYQRMGSLLRGTVRQRTQIGAERIFFPKLGKGIATDKARHGDVVPMNLAHDRVFADMVDKYAPEYIDKLDQVKINWSLRRDYANASAWALGRQTDQQIIDALDLGTNTSDATTINTAAGVTPDDEMSLAVISTMEERLNERDVPLDTMRWAVISPAALAQMQRNIDGFTSSDFNTQKPLADGRPPSNFFMGFNWVMHSGLPAGTLGYFYHMQSVGHGIAQDVTSEVNYVAQKVAWLVNSMMSMGAVIIDNDGVEVLTAA